MQNQNRRKTRQNWFCTDKFGKLNFRFSFEFLEFCHSERYALPRASAAVNDSEFSFINRQTAGKFSMAIAFISD